MKMAEIYHLLKERVDRDHQYVIWINSLIEMSIMSVDDSVL